MAQPVPPVYVSGADSRYWRCLFQLLKAARTKGWTDGANWVVYDLGMQTHQRATLQRHFPWVEFRVYDLTDLPAFYAPSAGAYAWKPNVIWDAVKQASGPVIWMDSANLPRGRPNEMLDHVRQHGLYLLRGQAPLQDRCDPTVLTRLKVPKWIWGTRECVTTVVGMDAANPTIQDLIARWAELANDRDIIRPPNCIGRHMNDQAVMNALALPLVCKGVLTLPEQDVDISSGTPIAFMSTRNKVRANLPLWADPLARLWYRVDKVSDQAMHRLRNWLGRHNPSPRMRQLGGQSKDGQAITLPRTWGRAWGRKLSDPCFIEHGKKDWGFFTDQSLLTGHTRITATRIADGRRQVALRPEYPVSQPVLFRHQNRLFMLVHKAPNDGLEIWENVQFPDQWLRRTHLFSGLDCAASSVFEHGGRWWLFTSMASPQSAGINRYLAIFHSINPLDGDWIAHPKNERGRDIQNVLGKGQSSGRVVPRQGRLFRQVPRDPTNFETGLGLREITTLSPEKFEEGPMQ